MLLQVFQRLLDARLDRFKVLGEYELHSLMVLTQLLDQRHHQVLCSRQLLPAVLDVDIFISEELLGDLLDLAEHWLGEGSPVGQLFEVVRQRLSTAVVNASSLINVQFGLIDDSGSAFSIGCPE